MISITLFLIGCTNDVAIIPYETTATSLNAIITSDLHYIHKNNSVDTITPLVAYSDSFMTCLIDQVIDASPDVFIATGDLTNDGSAIDNQHLSSHLKRLVDANITVILTTGNHDYGRDDIASFEQYLFPLLSIDSKDLNSLSYTTIVNDICFIAMDDGYSTNGDQGHFSTQTMDWLKQQLILANQNAHKIIFLAHHSVLYNDTDSQQRYSITNENLYNLLKQYHVQICFTGHQHTQSRLQSDDMHEIISSTPLSGSHLLGSFSIQDHLFNYQTTPMNFEKYADDTLLEAYYNIQDTSIASLKEIYEPLFTSQQISKEDQEGIFTLFMKFTLYAQDGVLAQYYDTIQSDPYYAKMLEALDDYNYGPWMRALMKDVPLDASQFTFTFD